MSNTKTFRELQEVDQLVGTLYQKDENLKDTKFGYAYKRFADKFYIPILKELDEALINVRVEHALEDPVSKEILMDTKTARGFKYSKEGIKKVIEAERNVVKEYEAKAFEVEPFVSSYVPEYLTEEEAEQLKGIIL